MALHLDMRPSTECARQIGFDPINRTTWQVLTDQVARPDTHSFHSLTVYLWWQKMFVMPRGVSCAHLHCRGFRWIGRITIWMEWYFFFSALFAFCYLPFSIPSICNWRFVAPKELSFVMVIQSTRPVLLVWQINVRLHDNIQRTKSMPKTRWKRSYFVCGMVASSSWLHAAMVVVCTLYTSCGGKYLSSRRRKVVSINYWALIYFCVSHTMPRARCPSD